MHFQWDPIKKLDFMGKYLTLQGLGAMTLHTLR